MDWCLNKNLADQYKKEIANETEFQKLKKMSFEQRREFFSEKFGKENAKELNAFFESKLILPNQKKAAYNWAKKEFGAKSIHFRDIVSKLRRLDKEIITSGGKTTTKLKQIIGGIPEEFLGDLAAKKLGLQVSQKQTKNIVDMYKVSEDLKKKIPDKKSADYDEKRIEYGLSAISLRNYVEDIRLNTNKMNIKEYLTSPKAWAMDAFGTFKTIKASFDNSFWLRQGVKALYNPKYTKIWVKNFSKSFGDLGRGFFKVNPLDVVKAEIVSRENALNGKYKAAGGMGLDFISEEEFPSQLPEKIPVIGRLLKASSTAYNAAAWRMRADIADMLIEGAEAHGMDMTNPKQAKEIGNLVGTITGRSKLGKLEPVGNILNVALFSPRFFASHLSTLTTPFRSGINSFTRKEAAKNLASTIILPAIILGIAKSIDDESVDFDPRSANFGKIKIGNTRIDVTGGMASVLNLAARFSPTKHNGKWGEWYKSSTTNSFTKLGGGYGKTSFKDILYGFVEGKASPGARVFIDMWEGQDFSGRKLSPKVWAENLLIPIPVTTLKELLDDPKSAPLLLGLIAEGLGASTSTYSAGNKQKDTVLDWFGKDSAKYWKKYKEGVK